MKTISTFVVFVLLSFMHFFVSAKLIETDRGKTDSTFQREKAFIEQLALSTSATIPSYPTISVSHDKNYFRTQSNAVWLVRVTSRSSSGLQVNLAPDPNFIITAINAPAKWTCNIATKTCTRADDGSTSIFEFIQVVGTINTSAPATITNGATLTGGGLSSPSYQTDNVLVYNPSIVVQWGINTFYQTNDKPTGPGYTQLAFGVRESVALTADGSIVEWGNLSNNVAKPSGSGYLALTAGGDHRVAITGDGHIVAWGKNYSGQLNGIPTGSGFIAIAATEVSTIALTNEGKVVQWGTYDATDFPSGGGGEFVAIAGGYDNSHALTYNGVNYAWGATNVNQRTGIPPGSGYKAIAANNYNGLAQRQDGTLQMWGSTLNNPTSGLPIVAVAAFGAGPLTAVSWAMYSDGSMSLWGDFSNFYQPNKPGTGGYAVGSVILGLGSAGVLLPLANPTVNGGNGQSAKVNTAFATPLSVKVLDGIGNAVQNLSITFTAPASGASGTFSNNTNSITVLTNSDGIASATFTTNGTGGQYNVTASYPGLNAVSFSLTNIPHRIYVNHANTSGTYDGYTWATAFNNLQTALAAATTNDSIWVAKGTYYPDEGQGQTNNNRHAAFAMKNNVSIYGGFFGTETLLSQRNLSANVTILSGDIDKNDVSNNISSNSYHIIYNGNTIDNTAVLDGFVLTGGIANGDGDSRNGGAIFNDGKNGICHPVFRNCIFRFNQGGSGGAVYIDGDKGSCNPTFTNCLFYGNQAIHNDHASSGGAIYCVGSVVSTLTNCTFSNNSALGYGGGIFNVFNFGSPNFTFNNCIFWGNTAANGNQIYSFVSTMNISNTIIEGGVAALIHINSGTINDNGGNSTSDPLFADVTNGDFRLRPCSPAIDKGATGSDIPSTDILGNPRFDMSGVGISIVDLGAYETQTPAPTIPTVTAPANLSVYFPNTLMLTATCPAGTVKWSDASTGTGITLSGIGTYAISATCVLDGCTSNASTSTNLEIKRSHRIYVNHANTSGTYNGFTWATAFKDLQTALASAIANDSIWVAKGTYYPDEGTGQTDNNRSAAFTMKNNVAIYGGFSGTETLLSQRNLSTNLTILSGDIDKNDVSSDISGNSYHIIYNGNTTQNTAILDGFVLSGGNADVLSNNNYIGGAVFNDGKNGICHPVFRNCIFRFNKAGSGGAVSNYGSNGSCNPTFTNCLFYGNQAVHNSHLSFGGAMYCLGNVISTLTNCTFINNYALGYGGGLMSDTNFGSPNLTLNNCIFWGNIAAGGGNQIYNFSSSLNFSHTILEGGLVGISTIGTIANISDNGGNIFTNPLFVDAANGDFRLKPCSPAIDMGATGSDIPSTDILGNTRFDMPGVGTSIVDIGAYERQTSAPVAAPTVTAPTNLSVYYPATLQLTATCPAGTVQWSDGSTGTGITLSSIGTYAISATCVLDGCSSNASTSINLTINKPHRIYVNHANSSGTYNGITWATAYVDLQTALAAATTNDSIWVAKGTYYPDEGTGQTDNNRLAAFTMKNNVAIYGGFSGTETLLSQRNLSTNATILSGDIDKNDVSSDISGNSYHVIYNGNTTDNTAILDGFVLSGGNADVSGNKAGGAVYNYGRNGICHPIFRNCIFRFNKAGTGGAVYNDGSSGSCNPTFTNCLFYGNQAIHNDHASSGGAFYCSDNVLSTLTNCTFINNSAIGNGGGIYMSYTTSSPNLTLNNCIFWGNTATRSGNQIYNYSSSMNFSHTILEGGLGGISTIGTIANINDNGGNISADPLFVDAANGDFSLKPCSPAIDAGATGSDIPATDILGNTRFDMPGIGTSIVDIGAYERQTAAPVAVPTVTAPTNLSVYYPATLQLTATCPAGTVQWSDGSTGTGITLSSIGTYAISATCALDGCSSNASTSINLTINKPHRIYVNHANTSGTYNGITWATAFADLQDALASATANDSIWVAKGTYYPTTTSDRTISFNMKNNLAIYGGFSGTETHLSQRNLSANATILSGDLDQNDTEDLTDGSHSGNSSHVISNGNTINNTAILDGFIITCGYTTGFSPGGGGIFNDGRNGICNPVIRNCIFRLNLGNKGAAVANYGDGGSCKPTFTNCLFYGNQVLLSGGASYGGAMYCQGNVESVLTSCTFSNNYAFTFGGAIYCTTANSETPKLTLKNCILWGNTDARTGVNQIHNIGSTINISNTILEGGFEGITGNSGTNNNDGTNSTDNPIFMDAANKNFSLQACSPAIDKGATGGDVPATDILGNPRFDMPGVGTSIVDIGAYERQTPSSLAGPTVSTPTQSIVCAPNSIVLTAICTTGTVLWSNSATGTSIDISTVGTYSITATCVSNGCSSDASTARVLEIKAKPTAPTVSTPTNAIVCAPNSIILTATCTTGTVLWSNSATGTSIDISTVGTYSITATCVSNGCSSDASTARILEIKAKPTAPTVSTPTQSIVCAPNSIILTATCTTGTVLWSNSATGTSIDISTVGTYSITATCVSNGCSSDASTARVLEIKAKPTVPTVSTPAQSIVCSPNKITLTATCTTGTVLWSNSAAGTSVDISTVGTYSITATCVSNGCSSDASSARVLEIKAKPTAPTVSTPTNAIVCAPNSIILTATCATGTVLWSNSATGTSIDISTVGTYSITATCISNGCSSDASSARVLEIKAKPTAPTVRTPSQAIVCAPNSISLTASCATGTVLWSNSATGTSIDISTVGTYSITATCVSNGCSSDASTARVLEIKAKPTAPTVSTQAQSIVCAPNSIMLTATCATGTVLWSNSATGTSIDISTVGTYSITATCVSNGCSSNASTARVLEIKAKPTAPTVSTPAQSIVCAPNSIILTATCATGTILWLNSATGTSITLSDVGTYSITAKCVFNGCESDASTARSIEIKALPIVSATNTGPYTVGQTINLAGTGNGTHNWSGPNSFTSSSSNPSIPNAISVNGGLYTLAVIGVNGCNAMATTNVIVNGVDPCDPSRIVDYMYVKAGNPYQPLFSLNNGMIINQINEQISILVTPSLCPSVTIESFEMNIQGPELNWNILQNVSPNALFDNLGLDIWGRNFVPGNYTLTATGYAQDNKGGGVTYGPKIIKFTVVGNLATINAPTLSKNSICAGSSIDVTFNTSGTFNIGNQFNIELSDSSGSFANPVLIGTNNTIGTHTCTIPQNLPEGEKYLIRVTSSNQVAVSNPAISRVTIYPYSYTLDNQINNITGDVAKKAASTINATNKIISPANVTYQAGKSILLMPGFETEAIFKAEIKGCDN